MSSLSNSSRSCLRVATFIDGSWLYHNQRKISPDGEAFKINYGKINTLGLEYLARMMELRTGITPALDLVRTHYYASLPVNAHADDLGAVEGQRKFYDMLRKEHGFEVFLHEIDFRGCHVAARDREYSAEELSFSPKERTIDMALGINLLYLAMLDAYDVALVVLGDADFKPALAAVRNIGKRVLIFTIEGACSFEYLKAEAGAVYGDYPALVMQDYLGVLRYEQQARPQYQYTCARCGKKFESGYKAVPGQRMYCDEHRIWKSADANGKLQLLKDATINDDQAAAAGKGLLYA